MGEDFPFSGYVVGLAIFDGLGIDRHDNALRAELLGRGAHEIGVVYRGRIDRDLVGACQQQPANILDSAHAATNRQRHEAGLCRPRHHVEDDVAVLVAGGDVEEAQLVGAGLVIDLRLFHRIARITQAHKVDALHDASVLHIEAGNDPNLQHQAPSRRRANAAARSIRPS
jgi:hypothetical protein